MLVTKPTAVIVSLSEKCQLLCPVCGGSMEDLRGQERCQRCAFTICCGCEDESIIAMRSGGFQPPPT